MKYQYSERVLILILALISTVYIGLNLIQPNLSVRIAQEDKILSGNMEPPYQYRVIEPLLGKGLQTLLIPVLPEASARHLFAYMIMTFFVLCNVFSIFHWLLSRLSFPPLAALIGVILLQLVIPLSVTGYYMEGDFITLLFYLLGLSLMLQGRDLLLPVIIGAAVLNRDQIIFLLVFYWAYRLGHPKGITKRALLVTALSLGMFLISYLGLPYYFGFKTSQYTIQAPIANNTDLSHVLWILWLWSAEVLGFTMLCILAFRQSARFFRLSFLSLGMYIILFFLNGNLWEMAKFLPAFLVLIPMSLQVLTGHRIDESVLYKSASPSKRSMDGAGRQEVSHSK